MPIKTKPSSSPGFPGTDSLRVLVVSDAIASRNGVGSYYSDLAAHLNRLIGYAALISPGAENSREYVHGLDLPLPGDPTQRLYLPKVFRLWQGVKTFRPHAVIIPTPGPFGLLGFAAARYLGLPVCAGYHTRYEKLTDIYWAAAFSALTRFFLERANRGLFEHSAKVVANSAEMVEDARENGAVDPQMIGTPIAPAFLDGPFPELGESLCSVCYAGRLAPEKNIGDVLKAARALPDIRFTIAGDGPLREDVADAAREAPNMEYVGWVSREGVKDVIDGADMLMLPSVEEAFGTIALEAMARRRLVLVSANCGILNWPELAGGVEAIHPSESLAEAIIRVSEADPSWRRGKAATAGEAAQAFNRRTMGQWVDLLKSIANLPSGMAA